MSEKHPRKTIAVGTLFRTSTHPDDLNVVTDTGSSRGNHSFVRAGVVKSEEPFSFVPGSTVPASYIQAIEGSIPLDKVIEGYCKNQENIGIPPRTSEEKAELKEKLFTSRARRIRLPGLRSN